VNGSEWDKHAFIIKIRSVKEIEACRKIYEYEKNLLQKFICQSIIYFPIENSLQCTDRVWMYNRISNSCVITFNPYWVINIRLFVCFSFFRCHWLLSFLIRNPPPPSTGFIVSIHTRLLIQLHKKGFTTFNNTFV